jgi:hypothetical protein
MSYTIQSQMFPQWRGPAWFLGSIAYFGLLVAPANVFGIPFRVFQRHDIPMGYWLTATILLWVIYRLGHRSYCGLKRRVIHLDALVGFAGSVLAFAIAMRLYPMG